MNDDIPTDTLGETENYTVWTAEEPDGETTYHLELGPVTVHFFEEEWDEFVSMIRQAAAETQDQDDESDESVSDFDVELDWGTLYFTRDEWNELLALINQAEA